MNTYTWKIEQLEYAVSAEGQTNVVTNIHWRLLSTDDTYNGQIYGTLALPFSANKAFVAYADLTEKQAIEWLIANLGSERIAELEKAIDVQIEAQANPTTGYGLPWLA